MNNETIFSIWLLSLWVSYFLGVHNRKENDYSRIFDYMLAIRVELSLLIHLLSKKRLVRKREFYDEDEVGEYFIGPVDECIDDECTDDEFVKSIESDYDIKKNNEKYDFIESQIKPLYFTLEEINEQLKEKIFKVR